MVFNELQGCSQCEFWNALAFCLWTWRCRGFCCVARPPSRRSGDAWCFDLVKVFTVAVFFSCCEGRAGNLCKRRVIDNGDICGGWEVHFFGSGIRNGLHGALHLRHRRLSVSNGAANPVFYSPSPHRILHPAMWTELCHNCFGSGLWLGTFLVSSNSDSMGSLNCDVQFVVTEIGDLVGVRSFCSNST